MVASGHHRLEAVHAHRVGDGFGVRRHDDASEPAFARSLGDMHDHRPARYVGQRLARKPRRGHAGGDQDENRHAGAGREKERSKVAKRLTGTALIGVAGSKQKT